LLRLCYVCAMEENNERSYLKESTKTTPTGIRFDIEKLDFVQKKEMLPTKQKVVDFLLNKYWWENKVPHVTAKEAPPLSLKNTAAFEPPPVPAHKEILLKSFDHYRLAKKELNDEEDWLRMKAEIEAAPNLTQKQKNILLTTNL